MRGRPRIIPSAAEIKGIYRISEAPHGARGPDEYGAYREAQAWSARARKRTDTIRPSMPRRATP